MIGGAVLLFLVLVSAPAPSWGQPRPVTKAGTDSPAATPQRQRQLRTEQQQLQSRIGQLKKQLAAAESSRSEAADALAASEAAISAANRRLRELALARRQVERQLSQIAERSRSVASRLSEQERQLAAVLRVQFAAGQAQPWQRLVDGDNPNRLGREWVYLSYVAREKAQLIEELSDRQAELGSLRADSRDKQAQLAAIAEDEQANRRQLLRQQAERKRVLDQLARQIAGQRQSIASLERDEKRLTSLIDEIGKVLAAEQARRDAQRRAAARAAAPPRPGPGANPAAAGTVERPNDGDPGPWRGRLLMPVNGEITARFGSPRRSEAGVNAPSWKGVFIRAPEGSEVQAVAAGRVVFADWLRGFGNLMIVDHGDGVLSVYGNNETLLAGVGDPVAAGEVVAQVGATGGSPEPGLYFELRVQGRPVDPLRWAASR
jgi:septal ring factor EnvC (AmiA/AmiB activator)